VAEQRSKRVLIADEDPDTTAALAEHFKHRCAVDIALDGRDAINAVIRKRPDLVFLDIDMPRVSGVVVLKHIKTIDPSIAVVMVTANAQTNLVAEALRNGAFGYVPKPFNFRYLDHLLAMVFEPPRHNATAPTAGNPKP
jgi:DNA-binding NtrC family response regulator